MVLAALLPHGIIELPSFVIAASAGIKLGHKFYIHLKSKDEASTLEFQHVTKQTVYIVIGLSILFLVAGIIEATITPEVMKLSGWS